MNEYITYPAFLYSLLLISFGFLFTSIAIWSLLRRVKRLEAEPEEDPEHPVNPPKKIYSDPNPLYSVVCMECGSPSHVYRSQWAKARNFPCVTCGEVRKFVREEEFFDEDK